ncbi:Tricalbin-2 [Coemansia sp. RSA 2559]|nr:Tricalbin-2 [Coemansia sp. RSA 2559]KAJ2867967.1 Tricalbin-2 [Coemansia erecta]
MAVGDPQPQQQTGAPTTNGASTTAPTAATTTGTPDTPPPSSSSPSPALSNAASAFGAAAASSEQGSSKSTASSRFRALALNAAKASAAKGGSSPPAQTTNGAAALSTPPSDKDSNNNTSSSSSTEPSSEKPAVPRKEMTSKLIYDIARTKMMAHRAAIRLSSETGFIKLRSKPAAAATKASGQSITNGTATAGASEQGGKDAKDGASVSMKDASIDQHKAVVGWKEQGAINSGKKSAPAAEPSFVDIVAPYIEMVDKTGMWRNCAGVFGLMFLTYVLTSLRMGLFGLAIAMTYGVQWYRNSIERYRRAVKDDLQRAYERTTITRTLESVGWLNEFATRFWLMFEPSLSRMVIDIADPILAQSAPGFVDSIRLSTFTLGTKAPRVDGVRTYSELEDRDQIVMDWHASFVPNDLTDVPAVLRENRVNPKVVLTVRVGKGFIGAGMPILVEDMVFRGKMQVKLHLGPVFPHVRTADVCFLERPTIDFSLKPVGGDTFGFDIAHIPGLRTFILDILHGTLGPMFYAPNHFTVDVEQIISGAVAKIPSAKGVLVVSLHSARGLPKMDTFGKADPYVRVSTIKHPDNAVRTRTIEKTLAPSWGETMVLLIYSKTDTVQLEVFDWNNVGKDDKIGFVNYPMQTLLEQPEAEGLTMPIKMGESERGQLSFSLSYFPVSVRTTQAAEVDENGEPLDPSAEAENVHDSPEPDVDSNTGILRLFVRSASGLAATPAQARKMNVRAVAFLHDKKDPAITCPEVKGTDAPSWEVGKEIFIPDRDAATIHLRIIDAGSDRTIGSLRVKLDDALVHQGGESGSDWYPLDGHAKAQVRLNVKWRPIMMDPDIASSLGSGKRLPAAPIGLVKLTCHEGRNLKNVEAASGSKSDPYMRVMAQNQIRGKTRYIDSSLDPVWNETLFIPVHRVNETLALECLDWNRVERDKPLGEAMLKVSRLMGRKTVDENGDTVFVKTEPVEMWAGLRQRNGKIKGEIRFRASFVPAINFDDMLSEAERARGMLDMKIGDGGLVLSEEEAGSSTASSVDKEKADKHNHHHHHNHNHNHHHHAELLHKSASATPPSGNGANVPREEAGAAAPAPAPAAPQGDSIFSGMTGPGSDSLSHALGRYPRLPNIDYSQFKGGVLSMAVIGCRGLVRPFSGVFVNVYLNGNQQAPIIETPPSRRRGREHVWEDELAQAATPEVQFDTLMFDLRCRPAGAGVDSDEMISIGKAEYPMKELVQQKLINTPEPVWLPLDADTGEVLVFLRYDPVEDPELLPTESIADQGMVRMRLTSATNLPAADKSGTSDPYVVARVDGVKVWESETIKKTLNPRWNEQTELGIRQRSKATLVLDVYDWNQIQTHTHLGTATIPLKDLPINELKEHSYALSASNGKATLQLAFLFKPGYVEQHDDSTPVLLDVAHTVVKAPVTVIKGGASVVGNVVGGIFGKLGHKKPTFLGGRRGSVDSDSSDAEDGSRNARLRPVAVAADRTLSDAAMQAMASATNMPQEAGSNPSAAAASPGGSSTAAGGSGSSGAGGSGAAARPQSARGAAPALLASPRIDESADAFLASGIINVAIDSAELRPTSSAGSHHVHRRNLLVTVEMNNKTLHKTRVEKDAVAATWSNERFALPVLQGSAPELVVAAKDHSSFRGDKTVARFAPLNVFAELKADLLRNGGAHAQKQVRVNAGAASVVLSLEYVGRDGADDAAAADSASIAGGASLLGRRHRRRTSAASRKSFK